MSSDTWSLTAFYAAHQARKTMRLVVLFGPLLLVALSIVGLTVYELRREDCYAYTTMVEQVLCREENAAEARYLDSLYYWWILGCVVWGAGMIASGVWRWLLRITKAGVLPRILCDLFTTLVVCAFAGTLMRPFLYWLIAF